MTMESHTVGHGPIRIIALHGWLSDYTVYDHVIPYFEEDAYTVAFGDYRGYGKSRSVGGEYTVDEIADDVVALSDRLGWNRYHMVGHSMAGMVIQKVALKRPEAVQSGTCITPVPASGLHLDDDTCAFFRSAVSDDAALAEIFNILTGKRHAAGFLNWLVARARTAITAEAFLGYLDTWTTIDFSADVTNIDTPIHVIGGAHDGALPPDVLKDTYLKQLKNTTLSIIDSAGHYPMFETPAELFSLVEPFIQSKN